MSIQIATILFLPLIFPIIHCSPNYNIETFPDSLVEPDSCNLSSPGFACDPDQLLRRFNHTLSGAEYLSQHLRRIRYATNCPCLEMDKSYGQCPAINSHGYTISIAVMKSIGMNSGGMDAKSLNHTVRIFAEMLRRRQHRSQCADDALIVAVIDWKIVYTSVGEVIERVLTPNIITRISEEAEPLFASANYLYGLTFMVDRFGQILQHSMMQNSEVESWSVIWSRVLDSWLTIFLALFVLFTFVVLVTLLILRFCCSEKQSYTVGRQIND
uniref:Uncharacterized protein n=1 Tax=Elaeophora elaphi TaxID=1147741 RepID=A0A0R3RYK6_9BILA